jgi:hypothetical protein
MRKLTVLSVVAVGLWVLGATAKTSRAAEDAETNAVVNGIADLLEKGDTAGAKKAAADAAQKYTYEDIMHSFKPRKKKGIGVGPKADVIVPDGIELKINALARDGITAAGMKKEGDALVRAGYVTQAIATFANAKPWMPDQGKKTKAAWMEWSGKMIAVSQEFTAAAKTGSAAEVKAAASKLKDTCDSCHIIFK